VRGLGPMLAIEFVRDPVSKTPAPELATEVVEAAMRRGLLILKAGMFGNCLRVLVSLVASDEQIDESLDVFEAAVGEVLGVPTAVAATGR
jgi:4-aminobutyrate aminotransferase/(S)-3-amino-2-methylpropionate transaminase